MFEDDPEREEREELDPEDYEEYADLEEEEELEELDVDDRGHVRPCRRRRFEELDSPEY